MAIENNDNNTYEQQQTPQQAPPPVYVNVNASAPVAAAGNGLGTASLVLGIIGIIGAWIPLLNVVSFVFAIIALALGIPGLIIGITKKRPKGTAIAGLVLAVVSVIVFLVSNLAAFALFGL